MAAGTDTLRLTAGSAGERFLRPRSQAGSEGSPVNAARGEAFQGLEPRRDLRLPRL